MPEMNKPPGFHTVTPRMVVSDVSAAVSSCARCSMPPVTLIWIAPQKSVSATHS